MYERLKRESHEEGLPLRCPSRLPNSRYALAVAEWVRRYHPQGFAELYDQLFFSHFGLGEDIGDVNLVDRYLVKAGADATSIGRATLEGTANATINESEQAARRVDVAGTPAWFVEDQLLNGLKPKRLVEQVVTRCAGFSQWAEHRNNISRSVTFGSAPNTICICGRPRIRFSPQ